MFIGAMINVVYGVAEMAREIAFLATLGINIIRFPIYTPLELPIADFQKLSEGYLTALDAISPAAVQHGQTIIIDMHSAPGGLCSNPLVQQWFADYWGSIALRYANNPAIYGFDVLNEPRCDAKTWNRIAASVAAKIRVNTSKPIIIMSRQSDPRYFKDLKPVPFANVIYAFHFYLSTDITAQGTGKKVGKRYTGSVSKMVSQLKEVVRFKKKYGVRIANTEFGCSRVSGNPKYDNQTPWIRDAVASFRQVGAEMAIYNGVTDLPWDIWTPAFNPNAITALLQ